MSSKRIGVLLSLKDDFTRPMRKASESVKGMNEVMKKSDHQLKKLKNSVKATFKTIGKYASIGFGALTVATSLFVKDSIKAAQDKIKADQMLIEALKRNNAYSDEYFLTLKKQAEALQELGVVGDDVTLSGASQLAMYKLTNEQIKSTLPILSDLIAKEKGYNATQQDALNMADLIGKALNGKLRSLEKYGLKLTDTEQKLFNTMSTEQRLKLITDKLNSSIGGTAKALRSTDQGKVEGLKNAFGDMQAEIGKKLLPYIGKFAEWLHSQLPLIQQKIMQLIDSLYNGFSKSLNIINKVIKNWSRFSPIIYSVIGGIIAYNVVTGIRNNMELVYTRYLKAKMIVEQAQAVLTGKLTLKQLALNVAMSTNPIGAIITGLTLLVGGIWIAIRNFDKIKAVVLSFWESLDNNPLGRVLKAILKYFNPISSLINLFNLLKDTISGNWDKVIEKFKSAVDTILKPIEKVKNALTFWKKDKTQNVHVTETKTIKTIGKKALGTSYFKGGETRINEGGRNETAILPAGTKILSHEESKKQQRVKDKEIIININIGGNFIGEREHMEKYAEYTAKKVVATLDNI